ncbi:hypothetical protein OIU34_23975 [Pararhizobium sp. BT-229]|uniref:hypothetical protein n=1 Tax=Pararhizobium sp. BT-229 TaxID=2986923 RepID=UPI0021F7230B|nr:hypothetical protein [Pararhizobium sp. BT-229]MCV9964957.1 hypothetical protein [Pararhizobium sp. BT-229]
MFDGIGDNTDLWRGRAAFLAGPQPVQDKESAAKGKEPSARPPGPSFRETDGHYLRYETHLPLIPGRMLASSVAAKRPEFADLISKALPHWDSLRLLGATTRELLATDGEVLSGLMCDMGREFTSLLAGGFKKEAGSLSDLLDAAEAISADLGSYPSLEDCVIEAAKRTVAFMKNASVGIDLLKAGGIVASRSTRPYGRYPFEHAEESRESRGIAAFACHPFLGPRVSETIKPLTTSGIDPETGEQTMTATSGRELGLLLADLCADKAVTVYVKEIARQTNAVHRLGLRTKLGTRLRLSSVSELELPQGLSPQDALVAYSTRNGELAFPHSDTIFAVTVSSDYTYVQDFIVEGGTILFSYAPGWSEGTDGRARLDVRALRISSPLVAMQDVAVSGEPVQDRSVAARLARRARWHAGSEWAKGAPVHRVRVACGESGRAVVTGVHVCGSESHFGIPYDRVIRELKAKRERRLSYLHKHPDTERFMNYDLYGSETAKVPDFPLFAVAARSVLSRRIKDYKISHRRQFLSEVCTECRSHGQVRAPSRSYRGEPDFDVLLED